MYFVIKNINSIVIPSSRLISLLLYISTISEQKNFQGFHYKGIFIKQANSP